MIGHMNITRTWRRILAAALVLALLPCCVLAETAAGETKTKTISYSPYAPDTGRRPERSPVESTAVAEDPEVYDRDGFSYPWLTNLELARIRELQAAVKDGKAAYSGPSIINLPSVDSDDVAVYTLNPEDFCGETCYVFLPDSCSMSDAQLMALLAAFEELGIDFDPDSLNDRNCCRHCNILETRYLQPEEQDRMDKIVAQIRSGELKSITTDTKVMSVEKITHRTWGYDSKRFQFYPYRRMTDEELTLFALETECVWETSPKDIKADGLNVLSKIIRLPKTSFEGNCSRTELNLGNHDLYITDSDKLTKYESCLYLDFSMSGEVSKAPSTLDMYHLQTPGAAPELACISLFYPYYESFADKDYPESTEKAQIAAAQEWARNNLLLANEDLREEWTVQTTYADWNENKLVQLVLNTPDWEINLWMYANSLDLYECRIYSRKWYDPGQKWFWS